MTTNPETLLIRPFEDADEAAIVKLWQACDLTRPWNDPHRDIDRKRGVHRELFLLGTLDEQIVAVAMGGYDGHRGWVYYVGTDPAHRRRGYATALFRAIEERLIALGCPKVLLMVRDTNLQAAEFYRSIGYAQDPVVLFGKRLIPDQ
jgi:ribosomal protein S18 acetylase RimI-like enzyme